MQSMRSLFPASPRREPKSTKSSEVGTSPQKSNQTRKTRSKKHSQDRGRDRQPSSGKRKTSKSGSLLNNANTNNDAAETTSDSSPERPEVAETNATQYRYTMADSKTRESRRERRSRRSRSLSISRVFSGRSKSDKAANTASSTPASDSTSTPSKNKMQSPKPTEAPRKEKKNSKLLPSRKDQDKDKDHPIKETIQLYQDDMNATKSSRRSVSTKKSDLSVGSNRSRNSTRSKGSTGSRGSKNRDREHCIEVQVSRAILQKNARNSHFLGKGDACETGKSATDILEDLFSVAAKNGIEGVPVSDALVPRNSWLDSTPSETKRERSQSSSSSDNVSPKLSFGASNSTDDQGPKSFSSDVTPQVHNLTGVFMTFRTKEKSQLEQHLDGTKQPRRIRNKTLRSQSNEEANSKALVILPDRRRVSTPPLPPTVRRSLSASPSNTPRKPTSSVSTLQELSEPSSSLILKDNSSETLGDEPLKGLAVLEPESSWAPFDEDPFKNSIKPTARLKEDRFEDEQYVSFPPKSPNMSHKGVQEKAVLSTSSPTAVTSWDGGQSSWYNREPRTGVTSWDADQSSRQSNSKGTTTPMDPNWEPFKSTLFEI